MLTSGLSILLFLGLLAGGLMVPGWLLGRALGTPGGPGGSLLGSAAILTNLIILLDALGMPIDDLRPGQNLTGDDDGDVLSI